MSKQTGLIRLKGTIGGVSFYKSEGEDLARIANGPDKTRINNDPAFQRTRENNKEFGGSAMVAKALRLSLTHALQGTADSRLVSRLTQFFKKINTKGVGARGQRSIALTANGTMLVNFDFNRKTSLSSIFNAPYTITSSGDRKSGQINIPAFMPNDFIHAPGGATHFRLIQALGVVSDYVYDSDSQSYEPLSPELNAVGAITYSDYISLTGTVSMSLNLDTVIPGSISPDDDTSVVQCLGIEFYQQIAGVNYLLAQSNALKVIRVF